MPTPISTATNPKSRLDTTALPGDKTVTYADAFGEVCVIPKEQSQNKKDRKDEAKLCEISMYDGKHIGAPKTNSTSVGIDVLRAPDHTKVAKFKPTGQNTGIKASSILAYYHLSRFMDSDLGVPVAVIRTVNQETMKDIAAAGLAKTKKRGGRNHWGWRNMKQLMEGKNPDGLRKEVITKDGRFTYGALVENVRGEEPYKTYANHTTKLRQAPAWKQATTKGPVKFDSLQAVVSAIDVTNMVLLDALLSQQDRIGNVAKMSFYLGYDDNGELTYERRSKVDEGDKAMPANAVVIDRIVLKDNDAGLRRSRRSMVYVKDLRHLSQHSYDRLVALADAWNQPSSELQRFFKEECLLSANELDELGDNINEVLGTIDSLIAKGKLRLDLDEELHAKLPAAPSVP